MMTITQMTAKKLNPVPEILEMDVSKPSDIAAAVEETGRRWDRVDGLVHSVAYAPADALGGKFLTTPWESVATAIQVSAFSFKELAAGFLPLMREHGGSLVTLDFDNSTQAWPKYDWMGVSKAALESVTRYLARGLVRYKIRVNPICAGPRASCSPTPWTRPRASSSTSTAAITRWGLSCLQSTDTRCCAQARTRAQHHARLSKILLWRDAVCGSAW